MSREKLRGTWANSFPGSDEEWPYWWIEGDGYCLGVIDRGDLSAAIDLVEDHWESFASIKTYKAILIDNDLMRKARRSSALGRFNGKTG